MRRAAPPPLATVLDIFDYTFSENGTVAYKGAALIKATVRGHVPSVASARMCTLISQTNEYRRLSPFKEHAHGDALLPALVGRDRHRYPCNGRSFSITTNRPHLLLSRIWRHLQSIKDFLGEDRLKAFINFTLKYIADVDIPIKR